VDFTLDETGRDIARLAAHTLGHADGDDGAWTALVDAGLLALAVPERWGGGGLGPVEAAVVLEQVGRSAARTPALATLAFGVLPIARSGTPSQQESVLPRVAKEGAVLTAALHEPSEPLPRRPRTVAVPGGGGVTVSGTKIGVPYADRAHRVLVPVSVAGGGLAVALIDPAADGVRVTAQPAPGGHAQHRLELDGVRVPAADVAEGEALADLYRIAVAGTAVVADGVLAGALELTAEHLRTREQFGRPLATFQAVAQQIGDVYVTSRTLHLVGWSACWRLAEGRDPDGDPEVAAYWVAEYLRAALGTCHHLHGGVGLDQTYPLHRFSAAAAELARVVGGLDAGLDRLADDLFGVPEAG
jgi:alkylation response protein AidB-like acyl-CoA dehydrogenase